MSFDAYHSFSTFRTIFMSSKTDIINYRLWDNDRSQCCWLAKSASDGVKYHVEYAFQSVDPLRWPDNLRYKSKEKGNPVCVIIGGNKPNIATVVWFGDRQVSSDDQYYYLSVLSAGKSRDMFDSASRVIAAREWEWISMGEFITLYRLSVNNEWEFIQYTSMEHMSKQLCLE